jgi:polysaccharide biosynthesis transport protein
MTIRPTDLSALTQSRHGLGLPTATVIQEEPEQILYFGHYFWLLLTHWWKIALAVVFCTGLASIISFHLTPVYESTARIAIDLKTPSAVVGESAVGGTSSGSEADQVFNTELPLIQSDAVLRPVVEKFHLVSTKIPRNLPQGVKVSDAPASLKNLSVVHPPNSFLINISYRSPDSIQAAAVANAIAHSYILRGREMRAHSSMEESAFMEKQIGELKKNMDDSATSLAGYEKQLGVINPEEMTSILSARLLQLNTQYTDAQNDRIRKEADYRAFLTGSLAAIEVSPQAVALTRMEEAVHTAQEKMATASTVYGPNYAEYKRSANELSEVTRQYKAMQSEIGKRIEMEYTEAGSRETMLHESLLQAKSESDALNARSTEYQQLKRQAEANKSLYNELFRKVKEAGINGAFQSSAIRIADEARPQLDPVFPNKVLFIAMGFLFSLITSTVAVILVDMFDKSLRNAEDTRRATGVEVLGVLPYVRQFQSTSSMHLLWFSPDEGIRKVPSNWFGTPEFYEEAVNRLLSSVLLGRRTYPLRSILVTSAAAGEGKSTCVAHMAAAYARQGFRTLLIEADLRCPSQQRHFGLSDHAGLADAIIENRTMSEIRQKVSKIENLDLITSGTAESRVFDRVGRKVREILAEAHKEYDMVFIDAPPMLYFAEPIELASVADGVLLVSHAGHTNRQVVSSVLASLRHLGANTLGLVLNQAQHNTSSNYQPFPSYYRHVNRKSLKPA